MHTLMNNIHEKIMFNEVCLIFSFILLLSTPVQLGNCTRADVVSLLDSGLNITEAKWNLTMTLSQLVAQCLQASCYGTHVAQLQFVCNSSLVYGLEKELQVISNRSKSFQTGKFLNDSFDVPDRVVHRMKVMDNIVLSWDHTPLRKLRNIEILLTTPATGRIPLDYYYHKHCLKYNPRRRTIPEQTDRLNPRIIIGDITDTDADNYVIEVMRTSSVHEWLNCTWNFATYTRSQKPNAPVIDNHIVHRAENCVTQVGLPLSTVIILGVLFGSSISAYTLLIVILLSRKQENEIDDLELNDNAPPHAVVSGA